MENKEIEELEGNLIGVEEMIEAAWCAIYWAPLEGEEMETALARINLWEKDAEYLRTHLWLTALLTPAGISIIHPSYRGLIFECD
jgi:hypothetical protein